MGTRYLNKIMNVNLWFVLLGADMTFVGVFIQKYIFADFGYLKWLVIAMILDLLTGITKVWKNEGLHCVTSKGFRDTVSKCVQYGSFLIITHVLTHFEIDGKISITSLGWMNKLAYEFLILIEIKSVYENIVKIEPKLDFVKYFIEKIDIIMQNMKK